MIRRLAFVVGMSLLASTLGTGIASGAARTCTGTIGAEMVSGDLVVPDGATCSLNGTSVTGKIEVKARAALLATAVTVKRELLARTPRWIVVRDSSFEKVRFEKVSSTPPPEVAGSNEIIGTSTVQGLEIKATPTPVSVIRNKVGGELKCDNSPAVTGHSNTAKKVTGCPQSLAGPAGLTLARTIRTTPFTGSTMSMSDGEGSAFVPNDPTHPNAGGTDSLWLIDDNRDSAYEINPYTGTMKSRVDRTEWANTPAFGCSATDGSCAAGESRAADLESMAYDAATDTLYAFNGNCCTASVLPTAFRLTRRPNGSFFPESFQPLSSTADYTGAAWNPGDGRIYVANGADLRTYNYLTNSAGSPFQVPGLSGILSMAFSKGDLFVVTSSVSLFRVDWAARTLRPGWSFDLTPFEILDSRGIEMIPDPGTGNDQLYVLDGYDLRTAGDPLEYAVFVLDVCCDSQTKPVASFTWMQTAGTTVQFTDTSTGGPTSWSWDFGDGTPASTERNPSHTYASAGAYTVTLTASSSGGSSIATRTVTIPPPPTASFTWAQEPGTSTVQFTDTSAGGPTGWSWDFGDGTPASTERNPSHTFASAGPHTVTLTASNLTGWTTAVDVITLSESPPPPPSQVVTFGPAADSYVAADEPARNFGAVANMHGKLRTGNEKRPYLTFQVTGIGGGTVTGAKLRLFVNDASPYGGDWYTVSPNWIETGTESITWNNAPAIAGAKVGTIPSAQLGTWVELDLNGVVTGDGTYSFAMKTNTSDTVYYSSKEGTNPPELVVEVGGSPPPPPPPTDDPVIAAAGDIACATSTPGIDSCRHQATSDLVSGPGLAAVLPLGDLQYENGEMANFNAYYDPTWGRVKNVTYPVPGNREYNTPGASGYFTYMQDRGFAAAPGYYSFDVGSWHLIALNSNCAEVGGCGAGSSQEQWLRADLAEHPASCTLAYWHHPRFSSNGNDDQYQPLWQALYEHDADVVLAGHHHVYERFVPQTASGAADPAQGIRQFTVGSGGKSHHTVGTAAANSEAHNDDTFGVLELTLHAGSYDWEFVPEAGGTFTDSGSTNCH